MLWLLENDTSVGVSSRGRARRTPLFNAVELTRDVSIVETLLNQGADPNAKDSQRNTPLHVAATAGVATLLITHGATVDAQNRNGQTPLFAAARHGYTDVVKVLLHHGASVDIVDKFGQTPVFEIDIYTDSILAFFNPDSEWLALATNPGFGTSDASSSAYGGSKHGVETTLVAALTAMVQHGASVNAVTEKTETPLLRAATYGNLPAVKLLVRCGARVDVASMSKATPLSRAALFGHPAVVSFLLDRGASVHGDTSSEELPVVAAVRGGYPSIVSELLVKGVSFHPTI